MTARRAVSNRPKRNATLPAENSSAPPGRPIATAAAMKTKLPATRTSNADLQAKHQLAADMVRDLRMRAEALSANADRLLDRLS